jgi:hypothetical protein
MLAVLLGRSMMAALAQGATDDLLLQRGRQLVCRFSDVAPGKVQGGRMMM